MSVELALAESALRSTVNAQLWVISFDAYLARELITALNLAHAARVAGFLALRYGLALSLPFFRI